MALSIKVLLVCSLFLGVMCESTSESSPTSTPEKIAEEGRSGTDTRVTDDQLKFFLNDKRFLERQIKCAIGEGRCDPVGRRLKSLVPFVMRGSCPKCTGKEEEQIKATISHIQRHYPKEWGQLVRQTLGA